MPFLCPKLKPKERCIRLRQYNHGDGERYIELFHGHIPRHRISEDAAIEMMKALVLCHQKAESSYVMRCYLNDRGKEPKACDPFNIYAEPPEPGVHRIYCGADLQAWVDTVVAPELFRQSAPGTQI
jgi:hypothetical protein